MIHRRIGIQLGSLRQSFKQSLITAAKLGANGVELDARHTLRPREMGQTAIRQLRKQLEDLGLGVAAVSFHTRRGYDVVEDLDARISATKEAMSFAYALGCAVVVNHVGRIPEDESAPSWDVLRQALTDLGRHAQHCGAFLCARTGAESGETLARLLAALPEGTLRVDLDPGATIINGFSVADTLAAVGPHVAHVHARDAVRDLAQGRGLEVQLGRGVADFPSIMATLEEHRYAGYTTIQRQSSEASESSLADAVKYLRALGY